MEFLSDISLKPFNTFGINANAKLFTYLKKEEDVHALLQHPNFLNNSHLVLGGGSNILLTKNVNGLVIKNELFGIEILKETEIDVLVKCAAGEVWHEFVLYCIEKGFAGLENLSLIPGCTGASPMQNIGAYGVEIKDTFYNLDAVEIETGKHVKFSKSDCEFGYRESVFKHKYKNKFIIISVTFLLSKKPTFNIEYGAIKHELELMKLSEVTLKNISTAVINIRKSKLPDPKKIGNSGSFFKNPEVSAEKFKTLKEKFPLLIAYSLPNNNHKLAAGWLIEQCGLKGIKRGDAGIHNLQALVLVNYGKASGKEIYDLSTEVLEKVNEKFGVLLEREVNVI